ncbi:MAG: tRNA glutamyl-Q(34) synthetase GluQRS [Pirellulales bacterium]
MPRTRLAPSPTGALHLGNARTFLVNWALARQRGWEILLRIDDLDGPRIKRDAAAEAIDILQWLGIDWDEGPVYQTADLAPYRAALASLAARGLAYPCHCTRSQILAASLSAPHEGEHELRYPGTCRPAFNPPPPYSGEGLGEGALNDPTCAWRFRVPDGPIEFNDDFAGPQSHDVDATVGDFLIATKGDLPSYQLAVVVDDARQGITHIVRGDDLLTSTPRQLLLYRALNLGPPPSYLHLPLVKGPDGRRLAKRHGDTRLAHYRDCGVKPERIIGLLAEWSGLGPRREMTSREFAERFELERLPREAVIFTTENDSWLIADS